MLYGEGGSGKSTFIDAIRSAVGDYAKTADFESFLKRSFTTGGPRNDIARLIGARFVSSIEVEDGKQFAEGLVKSISGGDTIAVRYLHKEYFEYKPQFKLWFVVNKRPQIKEDDTGMWRRIKPIPFEKVIPEDKQDKSLKAKFRDPEITGDAILAWCIEGCRKWLADGLNAPEKVLDAIKSYKSAMSPLRTFVEDVCISKEGESVPFSKLYSCYHIWADEHNIKSEQRIKENMFTKKLIEKGYSAGKISGERCIIGLILKPAYLEIVVQ